MSRRFRLPALAALWAICATGLGALPPGARAADPPAAPGASSPYLVAEGDGVLATWVEPLAGGGGRLRLSRLAGDGWEPAVTVAESPALLANWTDTPGVAVAGDGAWIAWWLELSPADPASYSIAVARSRDRGASWSPLGRLNDDRVEAEHGFVAMVPEGRGARAVWLDGRAVPAGGPTGLRTAAISAEVGASRALDASVCDCCPTGAATVEGATLVAYRGRTAEEIRDLRLVRLDGSGATGGAVAAPADGWKIAGCPVNGPALAADGRRVAVAWFAAPADRARVAAAFSSDGGRSFGAPETIDAEQPIGRVGVAWLPDGDAAILWLARSGDTAEVRLRRARPGGGMGAPLPVAAASAGRASGIPRLARRGGELLVVWTDAGAAPARLRGAAIPAASLPSH